MLKYKIVLTKHIAYCVALWYALFLSGCAEMDVVEVVQLNKDGSGSYQLTADFSNYINESADFLFELDSTVHAETGNDDKTKGIKKRNDYYQDLVNDLMEQYKEGKPQFQEILSQLGKIKTVNNVETTYPTRNKLQQMVSFSFTEDGWQNDERIRAQNNYKYKRESNKIVLANGGLDQEAISAFSNIGESSLYNVALSVNYTIQYCFDKKITKVENRVAGDTIWDNCYRNKFFVTDSTIDYLSSLPSVVIYLD